MANRAILHGPRGGYSSHGFFTAEQALGNGVLPLEVFPGVPFDSAQVLDGSRFNGTVVTCTVTSAVGVNATVLVLPVDPTTMTALPSNAAYSLGAIAGTGAPTNNRVGGEAVTYNMPMILWLFKVRITVTGGSSAVFSAFNLWLMVV